MIINLVLLFAYLFHQVYCFSNAENGNATNLTQTVARFGNLDLINEDESLIQLFLYDSPHQEAIVIPHYDNAKVIKNIDLHRKTYILFNGHPSADSTEPYMDLKDSLFGTEKINVIFVYVDWTGHSITFLDAITLSSLFGQFIADILKDIEIPIENLHFIAHCAGAEIGTAVARQFHHDSHQKIPRMTVFDPFVANSTKLLHANNYIEFVDVYHAGIYDPPFAPVGDVDFYINAGVKQPGCEKDDVLEKFICHHQRSIYLYEESIRNDVNAVEAHFSPEDKHLRVVGDAKTAVFGHAANTHMKGAYYLPTYHTAPYLMKYF